MAGGRADIRKLDGLGRIVSGDRRPAASTVRREDYSATAQEQLVQFVHAELRPGRTPVIALPAALGMFHIAQQGVHLGHRQPPVGAHGRVAGQGGKQLVARLFELAAAAVLALSAFMKIISEREKTDSGLLYILCGSIMLVASCRFHLMSLILLLFYLYYATREKKYLKAAGITALFVFLWTIIALLTTVDNRVDIGASAFKILIYHVSNPVRFLRITIATLVYKDIYYNMYTYANYLAFYRESFLGLLGWLDTPFLKSTYFYLFYLL